MITNQAVASSNLAGGTSPAGNSKVASRGIYSGDIRPPCAVPDSRSWPGVVKLDSRYRACLQLGTSSSPRDGWRKVTYGARSLITRYVHPAANSGGWQWCNRYLVWEITGEPLRSDEHVHHTCLHRWCVNIDHLEVSLAEYHGSLHAYYTKLRDSRGRFVGDIDPRPSYSVPRFGLIIGSAARELLSTL